MKPVFSPARLVDIFTVLICVYVTCGVALEAESRTASVLAAACGSSDAPDDCSALRAIHEALTVDHASSEGAASDTKMPGWLAGQSFCGWPGVTCTKGGQQKELRRVLELRLNGTDLVGTLPTALTALKKLKLLDLSSNMLEGTCPTDARRWEWAAGVAIGCLVLQMRARLLW